MSIHCAHIKPQQVQSINRWNIIQFCSTDWLHYIIIIHPSSFILTNSGGVVSIALASTGLLSTLGITLATDAYGPVADNAGGIAEMAGLPAETRRNTDVLDALGNTTAAVGKGFAVGSAVLTALSLMSTFVSRTEVTINATSNQYFLAGINTHICASLCPCVECVFVVFNK